MRISARRSLLPMLLSVALTVVAALDAAVAAAQAGRGRVVRDLEIDSRGQDTEVRIRFSVPVRYLRHTPEREGRVVDVRLTPLGDDVFAILGSEVIRPDAGSDTALEEVRFQGEGRAGAQLELEFRTEQRFELGQGEDLRTLVLTLFGDRPRAATPGLGTPALPPAARTMDTASLEALVREGRRALAAGEPDRAVRIFSKLASLPEHAHSAEAKELLGVARERNGQRAHARAEYEEFLERYPDGEQAERVRQRLDALLTASSRPPEPLRPAETPPGRASTWDVFGGLSANYRRAVWTTDEVGRFVTDDSIYSDLFVGARATTGRLDLSGEFAGFYLADLREGRDDAWRVDALLVEIDDREGPLSGILGRQSGNDAGVLRRFDGITLRYELSDRWAVSSRAGFPVDPFLTHGVDDERYLYGLGLEGAGVLPNFDFELFAIQQRFQNRNDRTAIGAELQYSRDPVFLAAYVDYDVQFNALNTAFLVANWRATSATSLNLLLDYRNVPTLTRSNALLGQPTDRLGEFEGLFPGEDIDSVAEDRTLRSKLATLGVTHQLSERFQLAGDFTATDMSGAPASAGILEFEATGWQFTYLAQLIGSNLIQSGDVVRVALGYQDFTHTDRTIFGVSTRVPIARRLRLTPSLAFEWRNPEIGEHHQLVRPGIRLDWRIGRITIDAEASYEWVHGERVVGAGDERGYTLVFGTRYDF